MNRPVLYLLPGLLCDETVFAPQVAALADVCEIRIPSFRGLDSFDAMANAVLETAPPRFRWPVSRWAGALRFISRALR